MFELDIKPVENWQNVTISNPHFLQSDFWAGFKSNHGWKSYKFEVSLQNSQYFKNGIYPLQVLVRSIKGLFNVAYVPLALYLAENNNETPCNLDLFIAPKTENIENIKNAEAETESESSKCNTPADIYNDKIEEYLSIVQKSAQLVKKYIPSRTIFIRFDPPLRYFEPLQKQQFTKLCKKTGFKKPASDIQPPDTVILNLSPDAETLLASMKNKWRYNIRLAQKKGVVVNRFGAEAIDDFYKLYIETSKRDGIALHSKNYYKDLFECAQNINAENVNEKPQVSLYMASFEGENLAAIITLFTKNQAIYLYGASSNSHRNLMPAYLLQWQAIQDAKNHGCQSYDFYGIPPTDDESHPMHGLYRFKTGFGGEIVHRTGSMDVNLSPLYAPYAVAEKLRLIWFKKIKKLFIKKKE
ncbi:MAG: peptidoglycan bridge formation glycyltransferase FemA/FemB family protein [Treponemataceae bacterium]|nr:peptidoglycan bridge formation glycyltransferase FemA/FemB family protein [Treponemataceae bacterium]